MTHEDLIQRGERWLRKSVGCSVVIPEPSGAYCQIPDILGWRGRDCHMVECKVSRADFFADAKKITRDHNWCFPLGDYRWFLTPAGLVRPDEVPLRWGLLEASGRVIRRTVKAKRWSGRRGAEHYEREMLQQEVAILLSEVRKVQTVLGGGKLIPSRSADRLAGLVVDTEAP